MPKRPPVTVSRLALWAALALICSGSASALPRKVTFEAVVTTRGAEPGAAGARLPEGMVYLQRADDPTVVRVAALNREVELPAGAWAWQAEAPGFITVGWNLVAADFAGGTAKTARAVAVQGCAVEMRKEARLQAFDRLDVIAVEASTVYRLQLPARASFSVPAGRFYLAVFGPRGLVGVSGPHSCSEHEPLSLPLPSAPASQHHALLASFQLPAEGAELKLASFLSLAQPSAPRERLNVAVPAATVWMGPRGVSLFPQLPAAPELDWTVQHPSLRSLEQTFLAVGGGATALEGIVLRRRPALKIPIDYQPARRHKVAKLVGFSCGRRDRSEDAYILPDSCTALDTAHRLSPGLHEYVFPDLDDGQYLFSAEIDDEVVYGLGNWFRPFLAREATAFEEVDPLPLRELHLWGHLLRGREPVPGEVRVYSVEYPGRVLRYPTADDLLYHWFFFGYLPLWDKDIERLPPAAHGRAKEELRGLYFGFVLSACTEETSCRVYTSGFSVAGDGRLDLELGSDSEVEVRVVDDDSGKPIEGAMVGTRASQWGRTFHYFQGETIVRDRQSNGPSLTVLPTDSAGLAILRVPPGRSEIGAGKPPDYPSKEKEVEVAENERAEVELRLGRDKGNSEQPRFAFPDGSPLSRGFLQVFDPQGRRRPGCHSTTTADGRARFREGCLAGNTIVVLHPRAAVTFLPGDGLTAASKTVVEPAPRRPLGLRLVDERGNPVPGTMVELRYGPIVLDPRDYAATQSASGEPFINPADSAGEIVLRGVEGTASQAPEVVVFGAPRSRAVSLAGVQGGEFLEIVVP